MKKAGGNESGGLVTGPGLACPVLNTSPYLPCTPGISKARLSGVDALFKKKVMEGKKENFILF